MANVITAAQIKALVTPFVSFDPAYFEKQISFVQMRYLRCLLTKDLYEDYVDKLNALPADYVKFQPLINNLMANLVAYNSTLTYLQSRAVNAGTMENKTQWSGAASERGTNAILADYSGKAFFYAKELGAYLLDNADDYPLFDAEKIFFEADFLGRFFPI